MGVSDTHIILCYLVSLTVTVAIDGGPVLSSSEGLSFCFFPSEVLITQLRTKSTGFLPLLFIYFACLCEVYVAHVRGERV